MDAKPGLADLGAALQARWGDNGLSRYCELRDRGLKAPALAELAGFIAGASAGPVGQQRQLAGELVDLHLRHPGVHALLAYPLVRWLQQVLADWCAQSPQGPAPYRWLGVMGGDPAHFEAALRQDPHDTLSRLRLARLALDEVEHQCHHLGESRLLGSADDAAASLACAESHLAALREPRLQAALRAEVAGYRRLLGAWHDFEAAGRPGTFPDWCRARGLDADFGQVVYYAPDR